MKIIVDSREKEPWPFEIYDASAEIIIDKLDEGDYVPFNIRQHEIITGEKILRIERKKTSGELAGNLGSGWKRFYEELIRLSEYKYSYILCEFPSSHIDVFPKYSGIPPSRWKSLRVNRKMLKSKIYKICEDFPVEFIFCDNRDDAIQKAYEIFQRTLAEYGLKEN